MNTFCSERRCQDMTKIYELIEYDAQKCNLRRSVKLFKKIEDAKKEQKKRVASATQNRNDLSVKMGYGNDIVIFKDDDMYRIYGIDERNLY